MSTPPRTPPRFVPTLTEVVHLEELPTPVSTVAVPARTTVTPAPPAGSASDAAALDFPSLATDMPLASPLGQALADAKPAPASVQVQISAPASPEKSMVISQELEEIIIHRVMQRVDLVLDRRLQEAIATVILEQTRSVVPRLREEIESVVRHAVYEAVADELSGEQRGPV